MGYYAYDIDGNATWIDEGGFKGKYERRDNEEVEPLQPIVNPNSEGYNTNKNGWVIKPHENLDPILNPGGTGDFGDDKLNGEGGTPQKGGTQGTSITPPSTVDLNKDGYGSETRSASERGSRDSGSTPDGGIVGPQDPSQGRTNGGNSGRGDRSDQTEPSSPTDTDGERTAGDSGRDPGTGNLDKPIDFSDLSDAINKLWSQLFGLTKRDGSISFDTMGKSIYEFLQKFQQMFTELPSVDNGEALNLASQAYTTISNFMTTYLQTLYERENWLYQNEYNSPVQQMKRLLDAGVNPAFYFGTMQSSTAGEIGSFSAPESAMTGMSDTTKPWMKTASQILGAVDSVTGGIANVGGMLNNIANIKQTAENITDIRQKRPGMIADFFASAENQLAGAEDSKAHASVNRLLLQTMPEQIAQGWESILTNYANSHYSADKALEASKYSTDQGFKASVYGADKSYASSTTSAKISADASKYSSQLQMAMGILNNLYQETMEDTYVEESDGKEFGVSAEVKGKINGLIASGSVAVGADGRFTCNGKSYKRISKTTRIPDAERINQAMKAYHIFLQNIGNANPEQVMDVMRKTVQTQDRVMQNSLKAVASNYTQTVLDNVMNGGRFGH